MAIYRKYYEIPIHLRDMVYQELKKLENLEIMKPVKFTSQVLHWWQLKSNEIRLCLDLNSTLNKVKDKYNSSLPKMDDILNKFKWQLVLLYQTEEVHTYNQNQMQLTTAYGNKYPMRQFLQKRLLFFGSQVPHRFSSVSWMVFQVWKMECVAIQMTC